MGGAELGPGLVLVLFPARIIEILIEQKMGARTEPVADILENGNRRAVEIAVDMGKADRPVMFLHEAGQGGVEIASDQLHIAGNFRHGLLLEGAGGFHMACPVPGQAGETVETIDRGAGRGVGRDLAHGVAGGDPELQEHPVIGGIADRVFDDLLVPLEDLGFGHMGLHIVGGLVARAQLQLVKQVA